VFSWHSSAKSAMKMRKIKDREKQPIIAFRTTKGAAPFFTESEQGSNFLVSLF